VQRRLIKGRGSSLVCEPHLEGRSRGRLDGGTGVRVGDGARLAMTRGPRVSVAAGGRGSNGSAGPVARQRWDETRTRAAACEAKANKAGRQGGRQRTSEDGPRRQSWAGLVRKRTGPSG
jgi:hypothetical protein